MDYYLQKYAPLAQESLTPLGLVKVDLEEELAGAVPDAPPAYHLIGSLNFDTMEELQNAMTS